MATLLLSAGLGLSALGTVYAWRRQDARPPQSGQGSRSWAPVLVASTGLVLTGLLYALARALREMEVRARERALRMTEQLRASESRLRAVTRVMPDVLLIVDEDGRYVEVCTGDESRLLASRESMLGRRMSECAPAPFAELALEAIRAALETGDVQTRAYELDAQGGRFSFEARVADLGTEIGGRRCAVWVARDITERVRTEEKLRQSQKLESLGVLAGGIAHDFNNLLTAILGNLNLAQMRLPEGSACEPYLRRMEGAVHKAADLAQQMLAYSGKGHFAVSILDLNRIVAEMTELLSVSISKKVLLSVEAQEGLPSIQGDAAQIQQVVMNLVTNASDAIGDHEGLITIETGHAMLGAEGADLGPADLEPGPYVTLTVTDSGCGMDAQVLSRIFDPFFTTKDTGRGLGLSAMMGILRGHGAGISIQSSPGLGSSFRIWFPALGAPATPDRVVSAELPQYFRGTALLVDDEPAILNTMRDMAQLLGLETLEARDGREALEVFKANRHRISVILLDLTMPRLNGNETFKAIRELDEEVPVILCSGFTEQEALRPPRGRPLAAFLQKPYRLSALRQALTAALGQEGGRRQGGPYEPAPRQKERDNW